MKTIEEKNAMIAEFMGIDQVDIDSYEESNGKLKYHTSWDWLMPVVESIYNTGMDEQTTNEIGDITHALIDINLDEVYYNVCRFIEMYNKQ